MNNPYPTIVRPLDDYRLKIVLEDGEHRVYDVKPYPNRSVFVRLQNFDTFEAS